MTMGPAQKKYKAILDAEAAKKAGKVAKPTTKAAAKPKGIVGILRGRGKQIDEASGFAEGGKVRRAKR